MMQRRGGRIVPLALADKARFEPPKADNALLGVLIGVLSLVSIFALCMYWGMQPRVLANAGTAAFEKDKSVAIMLASRPTIDQIEQSEVAAARLENENQGLPSVGAASHEPRAPAQKIAKAPPRTPAKPKRVARVHRPDTNPFGHNAWAFAPMGSRSFGGFGSWYR
jgi:hypothetical protein